VRALLVEPLSFGSQLSSGMLHLGVVVGPVRRDRTIVELGQLVRVSVAVREPTMAIGGVADGGDSQLAHYLVATSQRYLWRS
jgi:hypothetical protein